MNSSQRETLKSKKQRIQSLMGGLTVHPLYQSLDNQDDLRIFMETHVLAVWDFMGLLKRLQMDLTCMSVPWTPSRFPKKIVRMINEITLGEESDALPGNNFSDHFTLYMEAMKEVEAETCKIETLIDICRSLPSSSTDFLEIVTDWAHSNLRPAESRFLLFNLNLAIKGRLHEVASSFFYGREKVIPEMFSPLVKFIEDSSLECPSLVYYLKRHIELDGDEHSHLAQECLSHLCDDDFQRWIEAYDIAIESLNLRNALWDDVYTRVNSDS